MKPKELKYPHSWENRCVVIHDHVWFIPDGCEDYQSFIFPGWSAPEVFGNSNLVYIEYCSGNGAWIAEKAKQHPDINWVAVEKKFKRVRKIWSKIKNNNLKNLLVICGEGHFATSNYIPERSVEKIFVNFPDPWPKKRHAKNRIIKYDFTEQLRRILTKDGELTMVTDDPDYSAEMIEVLKSNSAFTSVHPLPFFITELEGYGTSYFEELWRGSGKTIRYHQYLNNGV